MSAPTDQPVKQFLDTYHLWPVVFLLCVLGVFESVGIGTSGYYRLLGEMDDAKFTYQIRHAENQRRYARFLDDERVNTSGAAARNPTAKPLDQGLTERMDHPQ